MIGCPVGLEPSQGLEIVEKTLLKYVETRHATKPTKSTIIGHEQAFSVGTAFMNLKTNITQLRSQS